MPLSGEERRQLVILEQSLTTDDPALVRAFERSQLPVRLQTRVVVSAGCAVTAAFALLIAGIVTHLPLIGIMGFVLMTVGGTLVKRPGQPTAPATPPPRTPESAL